MGQLGGEVQPLWGVAGQCDRRDRNGGRARLGGSVLSRTMAGKVVGERLTVTGLGTLVGGRRVPVLAMAPGTSPAAQASLPAWLWRVEGSLLI